MKLYFTCYFGVLLFLFFTGNTISNTQRIPQGKIVIRFKQADSTAKNIKILTDNSSGKASDLAVEVKIDGFGDPVVTFHWKIDSAIVKNQRIDITAYLGGFDTGRYETSGLLSGNINTVKTYELKPGLYYSWRVLTKTNKGWISSAIGESFLSPARMMDYQPE